jgi:hypothetical protein
MRVMPRNRHPIPRHKPDSPPHSQALKVHRYPHRSHQLLLRFLQVLLNNYNKHYWNKCISHVPKTRINKNSLILLTNIHILNHNKYIRSSNNLYRQSHRNKLLVPLRPYNLQRSKFLLQQYSLIRTYGYTLVIPRPGTTKKHGWNNRVGG